MNSSKNKLEILDRISEELFDSLKNCRICPRHCGANRISGKFGFCKAPLNPVVYSYQKHYGEEPPISGNNGSGTIFFSGCNLRCVYCQNYLFSQTIIGEAISVENLAAVMLKLQENQSHNINLVTPTPYIPQIIKALKLAIQKGLSIPIVYNTSGYEDPKVLEKLDGIIDIYLPDMRYSDDKIAKLYSDADNYVQFNRASLKVMFKQVGNLKLNPKGIALKGLIIRHLILPDNLSGFEDVLKFISKELSNETYLSLMSQYFPAFKASQYKEINRHITKEEYNGARRLLKKYNFNNGWVQEYNETVDIKFAGSYIKKKKDIK